LAEINIPPEPAPGASPASDIKRRAGAGVAAVGLRQLAIRAIGFGGTVVLARLLLPSDIGAVAIGTTLVMVFSFAGDAGIGAGLIRGRHVPDRQDLQAFLALQFLITTTLALGTAAVALPTGHVGRVTTLMVAALPVLAFRTPGVILFERNLQYRPLVLIELTETVVFYVWAIGTVLLGWGVWGLASATPVRAVVGTGIMIWRSPAGFLLPRPSISRLRALLGFGIRYQAVNAISLVRDQGLNLATALIGGIAVLGLWSLAYRLLQVPFLLFDTVLRVSFPAMARLIEAGEDPRPIIEKGLALAALVTGALLCVLVGSTPALIPSVFGHPWATVVSVIPWAALGLMFGGPVSVATGGYLYAVGDSGSVLFSAIVHTLAWFAVALALLPRIGVEALGIGWLAASMLESVVLAARTRRHTPVHVWRHLLLPASLAALASAAGWGVATLLGVSIMSAVAGAAVAAAFYGVGMLIARRGLVLDVVDLGRRSVKSLVS